MEFGFNFRRPPPAPHRASTAREAHAAWWEAGSPRCLPHLKSSAILLRPPRCATPFSLGNKRTEGLRAPCPSKCPSQRVLLSTTPFVRLRRRRRDDADAPHYKYAFMIILYKIIINLTAYSGAQGAKACWMTPAASLPRGE